MKIKFYAHACFRLEGRVPHGGVYDGLVTLSDVTATLLALGVVELVYPKGKEP